MKSRQAILFALLAATLAASWWVGQAEDTEAAPEVVAEELRAAVQALGRITGRVGVEELLDAVFRDFCIGK